MGSYQAGCDAYERGDYDTAVQELRPLAEQGHPKAQYNLGVMYSYLASTNSTAMDCPSPC